MRDLFFHNAWLGMAIWGLLYISDYILTITCARLYQAGAKEKICFEGSYEITPFFQKDIDSLRLISPRFVAMLALSLSLLAVVWVFDGKSQPEFYEFLLGLMILLQLTIHVRHLRNLLLFRAINYSNGVSGRIEYSRNLLLRMSSSECLIFSGLFFVLFVFTQSWFILGGAIGCLSLAAKHRRLAKKLTSNMTTLAQVQQRTGHDATLRNA